MTGTATPGRRIHRACATGTTAIGPPGGRCSTGRSAARSAAAGIQARGCARRSLARRLLRARAGDAGRSIGHRRALRRVKPPPNGPLAARSSHQATHASSPAAANTARLCARWCAPVSTSTCPPGASHSAAPAATRRCIASPSGPPSKLRIGSCSRDSAASPLCCRRAAALVVPGRWLSGAPVRGRCLQRAPRCPRTA